MKRVVAVLYNNDRTLYLLDTLEAVLGGTGLPIKRKTLRKYLERLEEKGIVEKLRGNDGETVFRCRSKSLAFSYLEGRFSDYAGRVAPRRPLTRPVGTVVHRVNAKVRLSGEELEKVKRISALKQFGRTPPYYHLVSDGFNLKAWASGKAHVFLHDDWRGPMARVLGASVVEKVVHELREGNGDEGIARPDIPLPVGKPIYVVGEKGTTVFQFGRSQIPEGEFDRHGPQDDAVADQVEAWVYDEAKFKADMAGAVNQLSSRLERLTEVQEKMPEAIGEAVKKALEEMLNGSKEKYETKEPSKGDWMYG